MEADFNFERYEYQHIREFKEYIDNNTIKDPQHCMKVADLYCNYKGKIRTKHMVDLLSDMGYSMKMFGGVLYIDGVKLIKRNVA